MKKSLKMLISSAMVAVMTMTSAAVPNMVLFGTTVLAAEYTELQPAEAGASDSLVFDSSQSGTIGTLYSENGTVRYSGTGNYHSYGSA